MGVVHDLTGKQFGRWTVLEYCGTDKHHNALWLCECSCELKTRRIVVSNNLVRGISKSCGCLKKELARENCVERNAKVKVPYAKKHGKRGTRIYGIWCNMKDRCFRKENEHFSDYGGRGIKVCEEWANKKDGFSNFDKWAMSSGYSDDLELDRIDYNGNYEPSNCRWVTEKEQQRNKRNNRRITFNGETHVAKEWAEITGIPYTTLISRLDKLHWDIEKSLTTPPKKRGN